MKTFHQLLLEVSQPNSEDELNFKEKHVIDHILDPNAEEDQFTADEIRKFYNRADYKKGEDMAVYEQRELEPDEDSDDVDDLLFRNRMRDRPSYALRTQIKGKIIDESFKTGDKVKSIKSYPVNATGIVTKVSPFAVHVRWDGAPREAVVTHTSIKKVPRYVDEKDDGKISEQYINEVSIREFKAKHVPGLYNFDHYEHPNGAFIQVSPHGHGVYQDECGNRHDFDNISQLKTMFAESEISEASFEEAMRKATEAHEKGDNEKAKYHLNIARDLRRKSKISDLYKDESVRSDRNKPNLNTTRNVLQKEGLLDIIQPVGGEFDSDPSHIQYKKKNKRGAKEVGEPLNEEDLPATPTSFIRAGIFTHEDGTTSKIAKTDAEILNDLLSTLTPTNRDRMIASIKSSKKGYYDILTFAQGKL